VTSLICTSCARGAHLSCRQGCECAHPSHGLREDGRVAIDPADAVALMASRRWRTQRLPSGCHVWIGRTFALGGYPSTSIHSRHVLAHRVALVARLGRDLGFDMEAGHVCHDLAFSSGACAGGPECTHRRCVNPEHLAEQSRAENVDAGRTGLCARGLHPLAGDNLVVGSLNQGSRRCKKCAVEYRRETDGLIRLAARSLGVGWRDYLRVHGRSRVVALSFITRDFA
jgi:hypothetical protein